MENSTTLKKEILEVLEQLHYFFDVTRLNDLNAKSGIKVTIEKGLRNLDSVLRYLREEKNGLDISFFSKYADRPFTVGNKILVDVERTLVIKGESIEAIKEKIIILEIKFNIPQEKKMLINNSDLVLDYETCVLRIGDTELKFRPETIECTFLRIMSGRKVSQGLEWDEVGEKMEISNKTKEEEKRFIGDIRDRINEKIQKTINTSEILIQRKNNRYTLSKEIRRQ